MAPSVESTGRGRHQFRSSRGFNVRLNRTRYRAKSMTLAAMALAIMAAIPSRARADNPIVQTFYTADPAPMVHEGRLYLYTSHDEDVTVKDFYTMNDWRLYSTADMVNWTDHGSPAGLKSFSWGTDNAWAPQGIARNGKFYLYVPLNNNTGARIGVGVSNTVTGPFMDPLGKQLAASGSSNIDPTVFVDEDGQAYMYWGNGTLRYVKLNSDMISTSGSITNVSLSGFTEGPWFYKRGALYYMVYAATSGTEKISYATSNAPTGPWTTRGDVMAPGNTFTNHPGVVDFKGHSYFFYHNSALPGGSNYKRSVCVEEFTYGADGSIPKITPSSKGPTAVATLNPFKQVEAETIAFSSGLKTEVCTDTGAGMNVASISNGDYIKVKEVDFADGVTSFEARVSSAASNAKIELHLDSQTGTLLGTCDVSGASSWTTKTCTVSGGSGKHDLFLKFVGGSGDLFKFNWWRFDGPTMPSGGGGAGGTGAAGGPGTAGVGGASQGTSGSAGAAGTSSSSGGSFTGSTGGTTVVAGSNSGGSFVSAGGTSSGGTGAGRAGSTQAVAGTAGNPTATDAGGCSCRAGSSPGTGGLAAALWMSVSALVFRRRRR
jgi:arabinoxylan arabinofuranohydrolase